MASHHVVQFYDRDDSALVQSVGRYVHEGLQAREFVVLITNRQRQDEVFSVLIGSYDDPALIEDSHLVVMDAERTLEALLVNGSVSAARFDGVVGGALRDVFQRSHSQGVRAFGDMVDILWQRAERENAIELERCWNDLQAQIPFDLYCAYNVDRELQSALEYAMYETFGQDVPRLTDAENTILWLREHAPGQAPRILDRARKYAKDA